VFDDREPLGKYEGPHKRFNILIRYMTEYGQKKLEYIQGVELKTKKSGIGVDDVVQEVHYTFSAIDALVVPWPDTYKEMLEYLLTNYKTFDHEKNAISAAYRDMLLMGLDMRYYDVVNTGELARYKSAEKKLKETEDLGASIADKIIEAAIKKGISF
jgi:hypothetical protein